MGALKSVADASEPPDLRRPRLERPSSGLVEAALDRVLSSSALQRSPRLRRFLDHIVRHSLADSADPLKEYTLGVEVFERGIRFDPRDNAIVRVEALRLREKLLEYYGSEGASDPVVIELPRGAYRPIFHVLERPPAAILDDPEALCWQAESLILTARPEPIARARRFLQQAIQRWPARADLHTTLAAATLMAIEVEALAPSEGVALLRHAAQQAIALDARRGDAHGLAAIPDVRCEDKTPAIEGAREALEYAPRNPLAHYWAASVYGAALRMGELLAHNQMAVRLRPHELFFQTWRAVGLFWAGQADAAQGHLRDILALQPCDYLANHWLGQICAYEGRLDEACEAAGRAYASAGTPHALAGLGFTEAMAGHVESAEEILERLSRVGPTEYVAPSRLAAIHVTLGNLASAADSLRRGQLEGDWDLAWAGGDARWDPFRGKLPGF